MKKIAKRIVSALCALAMCATLVPAAAFAEGTSETVETPVAATAETAETAGATYGSDDDINVMVGSEIVLAGDDTGTDHKWAIYPNGGYDASGIEIISDATAAEVTVKTVKPGVYRVSHSWDTGKPWPMHLGTESFEVNVISEQVTAGDLEVYVEVPGLPEGQPVGLNFVLHYRGTATPSSSGNFDTVFSPIDFTAAVSEENGTSVRIIPTEENAGTVLIPGYYRLDYEKTGTSKIWDETAVRKDESIYFEVTENGMVRFCSSGGNTITDFEKYSSSTMLLLDNVYTLTFNTDGGNAILPALYVAGTAATLPTPTREGYEFTGWDTNGDGTADVLDGATYTVNENAELKAVWNEAATDPDQPTDPGVTPSKDNVELDKTATDLDENDQTDVTLSIGATEDQDDVAVLFVLDYSTSVDVRQEANAMLQELAAKDKTNVKVGIVNYWADAQKGEWVTMTPDTTLDDLITSPGRSGTNLHAGLLEAQSMLNDPAIDGYETYLITISDGITYLWTDADADGENKTMSVWFQNIGNGSEDIQNANDVYSMKYHGNPIPDETFNALTSGADEIFTKYEKTITKMEPYAGSVKPSSSEANRYWALSNQDVKDSTLIGSEIAIYKVAAVYRELLNSVDHAYALKMDEGNWSSYPYGEQLMDYLAEQDGGGAISDSTAETVFAGIKNQILYAIQSGAVTDVIGKDFDVADLESFTLTVGGQTIEGNVEGNTVKFGDNYLVTYYANGTETDPREQFVWQISTPVENAKPVQLTYTLKLVNKKTEPGTYTVPTNEEATLDYTSTTGATGTEDFPKPDVSYTVNKPWTPVIPLPGSSELGDLLDVTVHCVTNTAHQDYHSKVPAGSYSIEMTDQDTAIVTLTNERFVELYNMMNSSTTHTLADSSATDYTVELSLVNGKWVRSDTSVPIVFEVACQTPTTTVTVTGTPKPDDHPDIAEGIANGTWGAKPTATPAPASTNTVPQTSDSLPMGVLIVVAVLAIGAVCGLVVLRKRNEQ